MSKSDRPLIFPFCREESTLTQGIKPWKDLEKAGFVTNFGANGQGDGKPSEPPNHAKLSHPWSNERMFAKERRND